MSKLGKVILLAVLFVGAIIVLFNILSVAGNAYVTESDETYFMRLEGGRKLCTPPISQC